MESQGKKPVVPILVGLLVVAVGVIVFLVMNQGKPAEQQTAQTKQVSVPDVTYSKRADAEAELAKVGLKVGKVTEQDEIFGGFVISTNPEAGKSVDEGSAVDIVVSKGEDIDAPVAVPDLTGMTPEEAEAALTKLWIMPQPGAPTHSDTVEAGRVCAQSVQPGTSIAKFDTVTYSVSQGKEQIVVPDVTGRPVAEARETLNRVGLSCDTVTTYNDTVEKDVVINQSVAKGQQVDKGTTVTVEVSLGKKPAVKVLVPNIVTYSLAEAKSALDSAGLRYSYTGDEDGTVVALRPTAGTEVEQGSTVEFELKKSQPTQPVGQSDQPEPNKEPQSGSEQESTNKSSNEGGNGSNNEGDGFEAKYTKEQCVNIATQAVGAGGQATGPANNLTSSDLITGGGTKYYIVEFDLGAAHYRVMVDAIGGNVIDIDEKVDEIDNSDDGGQEANPSDSDSEE